MSKKYVLMCDYGLDDAAATAFVLDNREAGDSVDVMPIGGNSEKSVAYRNGQTLLARYEGSLDGVRVVDTREEEQPFANLPSIHGEDGMGDIGLVPHRLKIGEGNGVIRMLEALKASEPGEIDIIALGPLTNLALAIRLDKEAVKKAGRIVCMGSAGLGVGNATPLAEFNIWQDAEAAKIVVELSNWFWWAGTPAWATPC